MIWGVAAGAAATPLAALAVRRLRYERKPVPLRGWALLAAACITAGLCAAAIAPAVAGVVCGIALAAAIISAAVDVTEQRLPDLLTALIGVGGFLALAVVTWATGTGSPVRAVAGGVIFGAWILVGALAVRHGYGLGDVKLAASLGVLLAWHSWVALAAGVLLSQILIAALLLAGRARGRARVPLGPAFVVGTIAGLFAAQLT